MQDQYIPKAPATIPSFKYRVIGIMNINHPKWPYLILLVEGTILESKDPQGKNKDKNLAAFGRVVKDYLRPRCVQKVLFVPDGTLAQLPAEDPVIDPSILTDAEIRQRNIAPGGGWSYCQWPDRPCSDGTCAPGCVRGKDDNDDSSNSNSAPNRNTNSANSSNSNRGPSSQ